MKTIKLAFLILIFVIPFSGAQAQMTVGSMSIGQGVTSPSDWQDYFSLGIFVDVNTSACGFTTTPHYLVTLESITNSGYHWYTGGTPAIYNATPTGFTVYLRWIDHPTEAPTIGGLLYANPLRVAAANDRGWVIRWTGISTGECGQCNGPIVPNKNPVTPAFSERTMEPFDITAEKDVTIFPNPGNSIITLTSKDEITKSEVYDMNGKLLKTTTSKEIDIEHFPNGNYIVKVYFGEESISKQFIKME